MRAHRIVALLLGACSLVVLFAGCGAGTRPTARSLALQREDLIDVYRTLVGIESSVRSEAAATKLAWPHVLHGFDSGHIGASASATIEAAAKRADGLALPAIFGEHVSNALTGPASGIAGEFRSFSILAARGWKLIEAAVEQIEHGTPAARSFARANVGLYIESVYDAHFTLAQIGKQVLRLGAFYSEANFRLQPHATVKLGS
jgi:hypothetical protein